MCTCAKYTTRNCALPTCIISLLYVHTISLRFRATLYQCPETADERAQMVGQVTARMSDLQSVLQTTEEHSITQLAEIAQDLDVWQTKVGRIQRRLVCRALLRQFKNYMYT